MASRPTVVLSPLVLATVIDAHERLDDLSSPCLCTLMGSIDEDGTVNVEDAFTSYVVRESTDDNILPQASYHEAMLNLINKGNVKNVTLGWATTNIDTIDMKKLSDWARNEIKVSKFALQKRLPSPLLLFVTPPSAENDLGCTILVTNESDFIELNIEYKCINQFSDVHPKTNIKSIFDVFLTRVNEVIHITHKLKDTKDYETMKNIQKAISPILCSSIKSFIDANKDEKALYECMKNLAELQIALSNKLAILSN